LIVHVVLVYQYKPELKKTRYRGGRSADFQALSRAAVEKEFASQTAHCLALRCARAWRPEHAPESTVAMPQCFRAAGDFIDAYFQFFADAPMGFASREPFDYLPPFHYGREFSRR